MKVVLNKSYGGFGLSDKAVERLVELGMKVTEYSDDGCGYKDDKAKFVKYEGVPLSFGKYAIINRSELEFRTDKRLVKVVEELGSQANNKFSDLKVVKIPNNIEWEINEYDGIEWIDEKHRSWG